jgi:hypothetical protein
MHAYARPRQQGSQIIHIWNFRPRHRPVNAAALSYPAESADASPEYCSLLVRSACAAHDFNVFDGAFFAVPFRWLTLFSCISSTYKVSIELL